MPWFNIQGVFFKKHNLTLNSYLRNFDLKMFPSNKDLLFSLAFISVLYYSYVKSHWFWSTEMWLEVTENEEKCFPMVLKLTAFLGTPKPKAPQKSKDCTMQNMHAMNASHKVEKTRNGKKNFKKSIVTPKNVIPVTVNTELVLQLFEQEPEHSVRRMGNQFCISKDTVKKFLKNEGFRNHIGPRDCKCWKRLTR